MGSTNYPGALDTFSASTPNPTTHKTLTADSTGRTHAGRTDDMEAAMMAVQSELGTDPAGAYATVSARITATESLAQSINAQTGTSYAVVLADAGKMVTLTNSSTVTVTLPSDATAAIPVGARVDFLGAGTGLVQFSAGAGATVNATPSLVTRAQWSGATAFKRAANSWVVMGDLA